VATTLKDAVCPAVTVWLAGCVVIEGATGGCVAEDCSKIQTAGLGSFSETATNFEGEII